MNETNLLPCPCDTEIIRIALEAGFMLSTAYGQETNKAMPASDTATLRKFASLILNTRPKPDVGGEKKVESCAQCNKELLSNEGELCTECQRVYSNLEPVVITSHPTPSNEVERELKQILGELAGAASLCWMPKPTGEFDATNASRFVDEALKKLHSLLEAKEQVQADVEKSKQLLCEIFGGLPDDCISMGIEQLTTQIERMRGALEASKQFKDECGVYRRKSEVTHLMPKYSFADWSDLVDEALKPLPPSQFVLIERSELEKWPCTCSPEIYDPIIGSTIEPYKCRRCLALEERK